MANEKRKQRSDKGEIRATERDIGCITWIAEMYAARGDQIQRLLARYPDPDHPWKSNMPSKSTTREQIDRWRDAGWVVYKRILAAGPGWAYVTRAGLQLVDLDGDFTARPPSSKRLNHLFAINQVRLWMDVEQDYQWKSERHIQKELNRKKRKDPGPIPDGLIWPHGSKTAVEVQISPLTLAEWWKKLHKLVSFVQESEDSLGYERGFPSVWCYVPSQAMREAMEEARMELKKEDQKRVSAAIQKDLLMEEDQWT
jgi:hypothetical protein